jgi:hypothetical protein
MASYTDTFRMAGETQFIQALTVACADVAKDVFVEAVGVADHATRLAMVPYAGPRTSDFLRFAQEISLLLLFLNPTLVATSTDAQIKTAVAGLWTTYAKILVAKKLITVV